LSAVPLVSLILTGISFKHVKKANNLICQNTVQHDNDAQEQYCRFRKKWNHFKR